MADKQQTVRMRPDTYQLFASMQQQLNSELPYGTVTKAELLALCVSSASAAMAAGNLHPGQRLNKDKA